MRHMKPTTDVPEWSRSTHLDQITKTNGHMTSAAAPIEALRRIVNDALDSLPPPVIAVYRVSRTGATGNRLEFAPDRELAPGTSLGADPDLFGNDLLVGWAGSLRRGQSILAATDDLPDNERLRLDEGGYRSILISPVMVGDDLVAVVTCHTTAEVKELSEVQQAVCALTATAVEAAILRERAAEYERLKAVLAYSFDILLVVGPTGTILNHTPASARILGMPDDDLTGEGAFAWIHPDDERRVAEAFRRLLEEQGGQRRIEARLMHADGSWRHFEVLGTNQIDNPLIGGIVVTAYDVTDRKNLEQHLNWQALHDPLTRLANRDLLLNDLRHALSRSQRSGRKVGLLYLDLDRFKDVNDHFGHPAGDQLLVCVGERLRACVRSGETVARLGGDEFVVLLEGLEFDHDVERAARRILDAVRLPVRLSHGDISITTSIGIATASGEMVDPDDLLIQADTALYAAKHAGRARYQRYTADQNTGAPRIPGPENGPEE